MKKKFDFTLLVVFFFFIQLYAQEDNNQNIYFDSLFVSDLQEAAGSDFNAVLVVGDTIFIESNLDVFGLSLIFICNRLELKDKRIAIYPTSKGSPAFMKDNKGFNGTVVKVITKSAITGSFFLPGGDGGNGNNGAPGVSGQKPLNINDCCSDIHKGQPGKNGSSAGNGGNGGNLTILSIDSQDTKKIRFKAPGGMGGIGGIGGKGGITFKRILVPAPSKPGRPTITELPEKGGLLGPNGKPGKEGWLSIRSITEKEFLTELSNYGIENFGNNETPFAFANLININRERPQVKISPSGTLKDGKAKKGVGYN